MKKRQSAPAKAFTHKKASKKPTSKQNTTKTVSKKTILKKPLRSLNKAAKRPKTKPIVQKHKAKVAAPAAKKVVRTQKKKVTAKKPLRSLSNPVRFPKTKAAPPTVKKPVSPQKNIQKKKLVLRKEAPKKAASTINKAPMPASKKAPHKKGAVQTVSKQPSPASISTLKEETKNRLLNARKRTATPTIFRTRQRKNTPVVFTLDDLKTILQNKNTHPNAHKLTKNPQPLKQATPPPAPPLIEKKGPAQFFQAASLADILGFNPNNSKALTAFEKEAAKIPPKYKPYYKILVDLRSHLQQEINLHAQDALKRSGKDETSDTSSYSQHMADAGTDTFDRDFALSILSNEQDALFEIDEAIQRMIQGTYGICEVTGKPIPKERLMVVPFTRCSIEGQKELEKNKHRNQRSNSVGVFSEIFDDEHGFSEEETNES